MREILFRGKRSDGEWAFGSLLKVTFNGTTYNLIFADNFLFVLGQAKAMEHAAVIPETVGQFTGLTDKNGKKIFEGDIVHVLGNQQVEDWKNVNYIGSIAYLDAGFCVIDGTIENHALRRYQLPRLDFDLEVIGNIHDNPELLEE